MTFKALVSVVLLSSSLFITSEAQAHDYTPEQVAKAQELANTMKTPVDIEALLAEADKLGVDCNISTRIKIGTCQSAIRTSTNKAYIEKQRQINADLTREAQRIAREKIK